MDKSVAAEQIASRTKFLKKNFLASKGDGFRYLRYRILRPLLKLYTHYGRWKFSPAPWLTPPAIEIFDKILTNDMIGLEYGSGSSTVFFSSRLKKLHSIEHVQEWYLKVMEMLADKNLKNVDLIHIPESNSSEVEIDHQFVDDPDFVVKAQYSDYFNKVLDFEDEYFDFILIDGRARVECLVNAKPKLKPGGIIALDNSERERYTPVFTILSDWKMVYTTNGLTDTTIWFKP